MRKITKEAINEIRNSIIEKKDIEAIKKHGPIRFLKIRNDFLKELRNEKRYEDIRNLFGNYTYEKELAKAYYEEIKDAKGVVPAFGTKIIRGVKNVAFISIVSASIIIPSWSYSSESERKQLEMSQEAKDYDKAIKPYTEVIKKMDLNDLQLYMKLTDDMWKNIKGYGAPKNDFMGLARYDIIDGKVGVCRNFADHIATILNEVKPELNARTMVATLRDGYETAKIERNIIEDDETVVGDDEKNENINNNVSNRWGKIKQEALSITEDIVGNHVVNLVDCFDEDINKNVTLVIDPTNPGIGLYYNGEITMFNNLNVKYNTHEIVDAVVAKGGDEAFVKNTKSFLDSYGINKEEFEILANKYSLEAQNKALEQSREITQQNRKIEEDILKGFDYIEYGELYGMTDKDQMKDTYNEIKENVEKEEHDIEK